MTGSEWPYSSSQIGGVVAVCCLVMSCDGDHEDGLDVSRSHTESAAWIASFSVRARRRVTGRLA